MSIKEKVLAETTSFSGHKRQGKDRHIQGEEAGMIVYTRAKFGCVPTTTLSLFLFLCIMSISNTHFASELHTTFVFWDERTRLLSSSSNVAMADGGGGFRSWADLQDALNAPVAADLFIRTRIDRYHWPGYSSRDSSHPSSVGSGGKPAWLRLILAFWVSGRFWRPAGRLLLAAVPLLVQENLGARHVPLAVFLVAAADVWLQQ
jgi:hypothetical protein